MIFEASFPADTAGTGWAVFRNLPAVTSALDSVPDPVNGLLIYPGRGGSAGGRVPRKPKPAPGTAAMELTEPRERRLFRLRSGPPDPQRAWQSAAEG